jgi:hypothetical protein
MATAGVSHSEGSDFSDRMAPGVLVVLSEAPLFGLPGVRVERRLVTDRMDFGL